MARVYQEVYDAGMIVGFIKSKLLHSYGLSAKLGQILSQGKSSSDSLPSLTLNEAQSILEQSGISAELDETIHSASIGQVFKANINDKHFAFKILHPGIKEKIKKEIEQALSLGTIYSRTKGFEFDRNIFQRFLTEVFEEETDLIREGRFQNNFQEKFPHVVIPEVVRVTDTFLQQEYVPSTLARDLDEIPDFSPVTFFFEALLKYGLLHGDMNDRNWGYQDEKLVVYDFGCSQIISERRRNGLIKLLLNQDLKNAFKEFGLRLEATPYNGKEQELRDSMFLPPYHMDKSLRAYCDPWILLLLRSLYSLKRIYESRNQKIPFEEIIAPFLILKTETGHTEIKIQVLENEAQVVFLTLPISELNNLSSLIPLRVLEKIEALGLNVKELIKKKDGMILDLNIEKRSYKIWTE